MVNATERLTLAQMSAIELAEKRAIAVYGAVFASFSIDGAVPEMCHQLAEVAASNVPRPPAPGVPTALERTKAAAEWSERR